MTYDEYIRERGYVATYERAMGPEWAKYFHPIPQHMHGGLVRWILFGIKPGGFLCAILMNDLMGAMARADDQNKLLLWSYCNFLHNGAPPNSFGSEENFDNWKGCYESPQDEI